MYLTLFGVLSVAFLASTQQSAWNQCGGIGYAGPKNCIVGYTCVEVNDYYFQCQPRSLETTKLTITASIPGQTLTDTKGATTTSASNSIPTNVGPGTTLQAGYYWIRAVASPNFHKYLQTMPQYTTGAALLDSYTKAGQFQIVDGQLVELVDTTGTILYLNVAEPASANDRKLRVSFEKTPNVFGTFAFSGDTLTWSVSSISRPNSAAWLVCENQELFINLGAYAYQTPAGCSDQTIHYYNDLKANE